MYINNVKIKTKIQNSLHKKKKKNMKTEKYRELRVYY
jgi:hypothetical protein